jgi:hypothetical protein
MEGTFVKSERLVSGELWILTGEKELEIYIIWRAQSSDTL